MFVKISHHHFGFFCLMMMSVCSLLLGLPGTVSAHKFLATAWVEGDRVYLESAFGDGSLAAGAEVVVYDEADQRLLAGLTDDEGTFSFQIPHKTALRIVVNAGMGHRAEELIPLEEIENITLTGAVDQAEPSPVTDARLPRTATGLTIEQLEKVIEEALDKKLRPIVRKLAAEEHSTRPRLTDILGGIGYIVGLVGAGAYFNYRRKQA